MCSSHLITVHPSLAIRDIRDSDHKATRIFVRANGVTLDPRRRRRIEPLSSDPEYSGTDLLRRRAVAILDLREDARDIAH